jgi:DNA-directed RNA polymerase subunit beta'
LTEKATKDINSDVSGQVSFEGFDADEKRDRQGNISRTANRSGTIWVLNGDVYNLPPSSELKVEEDATILEGDVLAETLISTEYGGEVRIPEQLVTESQVLHGETVDVIRSGKELTVVIASVTPANAQFVQTKKELLWRVGDDDSEQQETFIIKAPPQTVIENGTILAELIDDGCVVPTSGEIRYDGVEVDEQQIVTAAGKVLFIPEEIHQVSKDISLKAPGIESGMFVKSGTELVSGIYARIDGVVHFFEENDIIHEVSVRPGQLHRVEDVSTIRVVDGAIVEAGEEVAPNIVATERSLVSVNLQMADPDEAFDFEAEDDTSSYEYADVLVRPVYEYEIAPQATTIDFASTEVAIRVLPVTQLTVADGAKLRQVEGTSLLRTSLVVQMGGHLATLKGMTELQDADDETLAELKIVVLEQLTIRHDTAQDARNSASKTQLLVKQGDIIQRHTPVVKTQVLAKRSGTVLLPPNAKKQKEIRRLLLVTPNHSETIKVKGDVSVKEGQFVRAGMPLDAKSQLSEVAGLVTAVSGKEITLHKGRPYLISSGTQLQAEHYSLVQQGDLIATLIFERQKTGDIVQGLPKVEELLEGRKPKDIAVLAPYEATTEIVYDEDMPQLYLVAQEHGRVEITIPVGANLVVEDRQVVSPGQQLTDGSINPHDLLEVRGIEAVSQFLVEEVQRVYRSQGVDIADKHIEIIVRQMTRKVQVDDSGDTFLLGGELVDSKVLQEANRQAEEKEMTLAKAHPVLLGITKASLNTESFISAASFQETTRVLTEAAVEGKTDVLRGIKENVIIGRLIPAGTGFPAFKDQRAEMVTDDHSANRSNARKPSAILEEIESMFGSPDMESLSEFLLDDTLSNFSTTTSPFGSPFLDDGDESDYDDNASSDDDGLVG